MKDLPTEGAYYVRPDLEVTVTEDRWSVLSEMMLLSSLQKYV